ncbi:MAG TPA: gluconate 2-dehydrogenase subunit 3 family protein [Steroidobacteraceae bacterium]|nr:gluconate 2-dehydrogenase subunit 3 family protein [Steroidobacteraceae bacterium]
MYELDRRTAIKWVLAASAALRLPNASFDALAAAPAAQGYGKDPNLMKVYKAGDLWPLTLSKEQRVTATALCDLIIPADDTSPAASKVGVVDFLDEWISAPYPEHAEDRKTIVDALGKVEGEAQRRFKTPFAKLSAQQMSTIADAIVEEAYFKRYRELTAGGFYTTPVGVRDLKYVGNVAMATFEGPTQDVLKRLGLA